MHDTPPQPAPEAETSRSGVQGRRTLRLIVFALAAAALTGALLPAADKPSTIRSDERVILFPAAASLDEDGKTWRVPVHGWVFEPEHDDLLRNAALNKLREPLGIEQNDVINGIDELRLRWFLVDNERGKNLGVTLGDETHVMPESEANGHFRDSFTLADTARRALPGDEPDVATLRVVTRDGDDRAFTGRVLFVPPEGLAVISDIDDTIKISDVRNKKALIENTFFKPFEPAPGMAAMYNTLADRGTAFFYVSSSPWQLYEPLRDFMQLERFPRGEMHLKHFRVKDSSFLDLFADPMETKPPVIEDILERFPKRRFILIGDSGEHDPEVYGHIAREHPDQITRILIRNVTGEAPDAQRFRDAFRDIDAARWQVFTDPADVTLPE